MGENKAGGYIFRTFSNDHLPYHVHIYYKGREIGKFDIVDQRSMTDGFEITGRLKKALIQTGYLLEENKSKKK